MHFRMKIPSIIHLICDLLQECELEPLVAQVVIFKKKKKIFDIMKEGKKWCFIELYAAHSIVLCIGPVSFFPLISILFIYRCSFLLSW